MRGVRARARGAFSSRKQGFLTCVRTQSCSFSDTAEGTPTVNDTGPIPKLRTPGVLAACLDVPLHRVLYVLRTRPHIRPAAKAGRLRLYDLAALNMLQRELVLMDIRQGKAVSRGE